MPTGNGLALCQTLAADAATAHLPIVVLTGQTTEEIKRACEQLRIPCLEKSVDYWPRLEAILRHLLAETPTERIKHAHLPGNGSAPEPPQPAAEPMSHRNANRKLVLVADDDTDFVRLLSDRLSALGCSVIGVHSALDALNVIHQTPPDLICLDVSMPSGNGLSVCEMLASDDRLRRIPVIILTGRSDESVIRRCHDLLAYYVEKSSDTWARVEPLVRELLPLDQPGPAFDKEMEMQPIESAENTMADADHGLVDAVFAVLGADASGDGPTRAPRETTCESSADDVPWVLCIDDDQDFSNALRIRLEDHGVAVVRAFNGMEGYRLAFTSPASAILLDFSMPNGRGDYVLGRLKNNPVTKSIPVIVITGTRDKVLERQMLSMGACAFLEKPVNFERLRDELARHIDILAQPAAGRRLNRPHLVPG
jgi:CheY-like chemotaxis protein